MRTPRLVVLAVLTAAALSACGGDDGPGVAISEPPPVTPAAPSVEPPVEPSAEPQPSGEDVGPPRPTEAQLTGDGIFASDEVIEFGTPIATARPLLEAELGTATDSGVGSSSGEYGVCPGTTLQALEFGAGGLVVLFGDVGGPGLRMYGWTLRDAGSPDALPRASALVGDESTFEFGVGTTVAQLQESTATGTLQVRPADERLSASFRLEDQSSGFFGTLTGTTPKDTVTFVSAGQACGE